jgi:tripartite-type tricarboxylate transporter receptor subunit TctC
MIDATNPSALIEDYPTRTVRIVESFGAGGGPDLLARALAEQLSKLWNQHVIVENITGAVSPSAPAPVTPAVGRLVHFIRLSALLKSLTAAQVLSICEGKERR